MKVVVAIDSLKGSLSSLEVGQAIQEGIDENRACGVFFSFLKVMLRQIVVIAFIAVG